MSQHRLEQYFADAESFVAQHSVKKMISDVLRLKQFLFKHQNESCSENVQTKLFMTMDRYYHYAVNPLYAEKEGVPQLRDVVTNLVADYLALPEGKAATAKHKKRCLAFLDALAGGDSASRATARGTEASDDEGQKWIVADVDDEAKTLTLMKADINSDACLEDVRCVSDDLFVEVYGAFELADGGEPVGVIVDQQSGEICRRV